MAVSKSEEELDWVVKSEEEWEEEWEEELDWVVKSEEEWEEELDWVVKSEEESEEELDWVVKSEEEWEEELDRDVQTDKKYIDAKVSVWWVLKNWDTYKDTDPGLAKYSLWSELNSCNYHGRISIFCYVNTSKVPYTVRSSLSFNGIRIKPYPAVVEDLMYTNLIVDIMIWAKKNPPPANLLLILGDVQISYLVKHLQTRGYNMLYAPLDNKISRPQSSQQFRDYEAVTKSEVKSEVEEDSDVQLDLYFVEEKENKDAKVSVWWDLDNLKNCDVSKIFDPPLHIEDNIRTTLTQMNYHGTVSIFCYGDTNEIPECVQTGLSTAGISIKHCRKDEKHMMLIVDMLHWGDINPPPANYLFILDDANTTSVINHLWWSRYNILLALSQKVCDPSLLAVAKSVWLFHDLISGGAPTPKEELQQLSTTRGPDSDF